MTAAGVGDVPPELPRPNSPAPFVPQQKTSPLALTAQVLPACTVEEIAVASLMTDTATGDLLHDVVLPPEAQVSGPVVVPVPN
jgi:hypothetical protein